MVVKNLLKKNWFTIVLAIFLIIAGVYAYQEYQENSRLHQELIGQTEEYRQLSEHAAKLEIQYKEQKELKKELEKRFSEEKNELKGRIKLLSNATYLIREKARRSQNSDIEYRGDKIKYVFNEIKFNDGPPIGYVLIFDDGRVTSKIYNHVIDVNLAVSRDEDSGRYSIISKADYILKSPHFKKPKEKNWFNEPYPLDIVGGKAIVDPTEPNELRKKFHLWALNFNGGFNVGPDIKPALGASVAGYGYTPADLDWKLLQIGMDYSKENKLGVHLIPALYRPFPKILRNTYLGPGIGYDDRGRHFFLGVSVGF